MEAKCPYAAKNRIINSTNVPYLKTSSDGKHLILDKNHDYYYQVQGLLFISHAQKCHFVVYTLCDLQVITVERNDNFINEVVGKLNKFFNEYFCAALYNKYLYRNYASYSFSDNK